MDASLRHAAQNCYHLTGSFSVRNDMLSKIAPGVSYRTADGNVSLRLILSPPIAPVIAAFTAEQIGNTERATLKWQVEPPSPLLAEYVHVTVTSVRYTSMTTFQPRFVKHNLPLSGMLPDEPGYGAVTYTLLAELIVPCGKKSATNTQTPVLYPPGESPTTQPTSPGATLQLAYEFIPIGSEPSTITVQFMGKLPGASGTGASFQASTTQATPPGDVGGPPTEVPYTVSGLQPGMWTITATPTSGGGAAQTCSNVRVPGSIKLSVVDGNPSCR